MKLCNTLCIKMLPYDQRHWTISNCLLFILFYKLLLADSSTFQLELQSLESSNKILSRRTRLKRSSVNETETKVDITRIDPFFFDQFYKGPVCDLIEVKNNATRLEDLKNCVIVNGFVRLYFINDNPLDKDSSEKKYDMRKYHFPKLRVITEYLLIYRVYGLQTLRYLFPNLVEIGGRKQLHEYALVVYENPDLAEIGLESLTTIRSGSVRIENNGELCYLRTVNWPLLGKPFNNEDMQRPVLINNKDDGCLDQCGSDSCIMGNNMPYCWGLKLCQTHPCPSTCPFACDLTKKIGQQCTCHEECLGGCLSPNNASACFACKNFNYDMTCVDQCPPSTLKFNHWQCVSHDYCSTFDKKIHQGHCLHTCPTHYKEVFKDDKLICEKCEGTCHQDCNKAVYKVTTQLSLHAVYRCTRIEGQLIISVSGADVAERLEEALGELEEVGALVVQESKYLTSLSFLKSLRNITGKKEHLMKSAGAEYSVYVLDNKRLRDLWNINDGSSIGGGKAFFHFNPMLCLDKIDKVKNLTSADEDDHDVSRTTNGDRITCELVRIQNVTVRNYTDSETVVIKWRTPVIADGRTLIGYHLYYRKANKDERVQYAEEEEDGTDEAQKRWSVQDVLENATNGFSEALLPSLSPYTSYACYVVTYTTATAKQGARSNVFFFLTNPYNPSRPTNVKVVAVNASAIHISWKPPKKPNGIITYYIVRYREVPPDLSIVNNIDTCVPSAQYPGLTVDLREQDVEPVKQSDSQGCCKCDRKETLKDENQLINSLSFEDYLIDTVVVSRDAYDIFMHDEANWKTTSTLSRYRRSLYLGNSTLNASTVINSTLLNTSAVFLPVSSAKPKISEVQEIIRNATSVTITGLKYYTEYYFDIAVCNHASKTRDDCSTRSIASKVTKKDDSADTIPSPLTSIKNESGQFLSWDSPIKPNGFIIYYTIELVYPDKKHANFCCSTMMYNEGGGSWKVRSTQPGQYKARVLPMSIAGTGQWSHYVIFKVEPPESSRDQIWSIILIVIASMIIPATVIALLVRRYLQSKKPPIYASVNPDYSSFPIYEPDEYEVPEEDVKLIREIGQGHFGKVFEGVAQKVIFGESNTRVAVKTLPGNESISKRMEFLKEASVMKSFNAHHVVRLLGVVSTGSKPMVIMEYMALGDLKTYLRSTRPDAENKKGDPPTFQQKLQMCGEIADGMAYLANSKFVHRDLAARNCLVHEDMTVKIGDFGLARDVYEMDYYRIDSKGILPVRWMAPESLKDGIFDSRSDVWSYGVVLWEISNAAEQPYQGQQHDQVTRFVIDGGYMQQPKDCPKKLYDLMLKCWHYSPGMRPTFLEIVSYLSPDLSEKFKQNSFFNEHRDSLIEETVEEDLLLNGSVHSADAAMLQNSSDSKEVTVSLRNSLAKLESGDGSYCHLNGGVHYDPEVALIIDKDDQYISNHTSTQLHSTSCC